MKIVFFSADPGNHRFITPIIDKFRERGYECQLFNNWTKVEDADVYWFDFCDNNLIVASNDDSEHLSGKRVIARLHAVEAYMGFYKSIRWGCVSHLIFVSDHLRRKCSDIEYPDSLKIHVIHNGVDFSLLTYRERSMGAAKFREPWNFGYVGNIVPQKGILTFAHYFSSIKDLEEDAKWYLAGLSRMHGREGEYWEHCKKTIGNIIEEGPTENTDQWLDDKQIHILVQPSYAESFSIIVAEAMAKGIKVAINDYWGARELWPEDLIYSNFQEFAKIMESPYESKRYREWVEFRYSLEDKVNQMEILLK